MIRAIIFDWHGVLDTGKFEDIADHLSQITAKSVSYIKEIIKEYKSDYTLGILSPFAFWNKIGEDLQITKEQITTVKKISLRLRPNLDLWSLLSSGLSLKYKLAVLSDCPPDKTSLIRGQVDLSIFDEVFFSSEVHKDKSSANFFLSLSERLGVVPGETLYVDDTVKHIDFARKLGYQIHHYKSSEELKKIIM